MGPTDRLAPTLSYAESVADELECKYCGARLAYDPAIRTPSSAWHAPDEEDPTACATSAPGHAPDNYRLNAPGAGH